MNKIMLNKLGGIELNYEVKERHIVIHKVIVRNKNILSKPIKNNYCKYNERDYMGFQLYGDDYINFCELTGITKKEDHAFISFDDVTAKKIKEEINQLELQINFEKELEKAKLTGENVYYNSELIPCNNKNEECNWDYLRYEITPDGKIGVKRIHTY